MRDDDDRSLARRLRPVWAPILIIVVVVFLLVVIQAFAAGRHGG